MVGTNPRLCNGLWSPCPALTPAVGLYRDTEPLPRSPGPGASIAHAARLKAQAQISSVQRKVFIEMSAWAGGTWGCTGLGGTGTWSSPSCWFPGEVPRHRRALSASRPEHVPARGASPCCLLSRQMRAELGVRHIGTTEDRELWGCPEKWG